MLLFQKLVDETQMPKSQEYTDIFILTKKLFLVNLRGLQNISNPVERPCIKYINSNNEGMHVHDFAKLTNFAIILLRSSLFLSHF